MNPALMMHQPQPQPPQPVQQQAQPVPPPPGYGAAQQAPAQAVVPPPPGYGQPAQKEPEPWYEDLAEGVVTSGLETAHMLPKALGFSTPQFDALLKDWKEDALESDWGKGGRIAGNVAQYMIPGTLALKATMAILKKGGQAATALKNALKAAK